MTKNWNHYFKALLLVLSLPLLLAFQNCAQPHSEGLNSHPVDHDPSGGVVLLSDRGLNYVSVGDIVEVRLKEIPSAGYFWHLTEASAGAFRLLYEGGADPNKNQNDVWDPNPIVGGETLVIFQFQVKRQGLHNLSFKMYQPWLGANEAADSIEYSLVVRD